MTTPPLVVAALLAAVLAKRAPSPRQGAIACALVGMLCLNLWRPWIRPWLTLDLATFVGWYALTAGAVWVVLKNTPSPPVISDVCPLRNGGYRVDLVPAVKAKSRTGANQLLSYRGPLIIGPIAILASSVLAVRFGHVAELPRAAFALALAAQAIAVLRFALRGKRPDSPQLVALLLALSSLASAAGPWAFGAPDRDWLLARWISVVTWIVVGGVETWTLLRRRIGS